jgi:membrane protease YdiL (CAAX protease family)
MTLSDKITRELPGILLFLFLIILLPSKFFGVLHFNDRVNFLYFAIGYLWLIYFSLHLYVRLVEKQPFYLWKEAIKKPLFYLLSAAILFILPLVIHILLKIILSLFHSAPAVNQDNSESEFWEAIPVLRFIFVLTIAFFEESFFRGYLQPRVVSMVKNRWISLLFCGLIFSLVHIFQMNVIQMTGTFILGILYALHYDKYRSLATLIASHFLMDYISI